jgi:hypothetical protein
MSNDFQPVVGHKFTLRATPVPNWNGIIDCEVLVIEPNSRLSYSWGSMGMKSVVAWTLTPTKGGTQCPHGAFGLPVRGRCQLQGRELRLAEVHWRLGACRWRRWTDHTQATRQIRFTNAGELVRLKPIVKAYIREAIEKEKAGLEVVFKKNPEPIPGELQRKLDAMPALRTAFFALTPGRQRAYILYFSGAKQSKTRESRIDKCTRRILGGKGLLD